MDWTWGYDLPITLVVMIPFWFLFILLQGRFTFGQSVRNTLGFAVVGSIIAAVCVWFLLLLPKVLF